ncbi:lytic transglycosylase domain-containing protein [Paenibacillus pini]|uniref:Membrane-bound lytic murein transglycosylase D n=1 Tax=Paenibacillus pini JCM 16418 TaxID=1236976 RepID=W7Y815_9BACL|nr:lytic transglycosylase domain-containing protein [Paenibacillus pini]GAF07055.1 membrane-bound lytic murein transglycosylase D precursor [Paenibacillus pini JCM 16418]
MQIDSENVRLASLQDSSRIRNKKELLQDLIDNGSSSDFGVVLQQYMKSDLTASTSGQATDVKVEPTVAGVSWSEGLLWQQLGAVDAEPSASVGNVSHDVNGTKPTDYDELIQQASKKYGVSESLIKAVIDTESTFNPQAVSSAGAKGLMQLMDGTAQGLGVSDSFDPAQNIDGGTRYLSYQLKRFNGQENMALAAYNAGPNRLKRLGITSDADLMNKLTLLPDETRKYIGKIAKARTKYEV